ncbi:jg22626, partial [Pararge aegeria aegeria]
TERFATIYAPGSVKRNKGDTEGEIMSLAHLKVIIQQDTRPDATSRNETYQIEVPN